MVSVAPFATAFSILEWNSEKHETFDFLDSTPQATMHDNTALAPRLGADHPRVGALFSQMNFKVELAGEGTTLGVDPNIGPLLIKCGLNETVSGSTSVTYDSTLAIADTVDLTGVQIDKYVGNALRHTCSGAVGELELNLTANQKGFAAFAFQGAYSAPAEAAGSASIGLTGRPPVAKNLGVTIGAADIVLKTCVIKTGNSIAMREDMSAANGIQPFKITNQRPTMTITAEMPLQATWNPWTIFTAETKVALSCVLGTVAKNILTITGDWYASGMPQETDIDGLLGFTMDFVQADETADTKLTLVYT